jgi:mannose-6-phosphate isomerase
VKADEQQPIAMSHDSFMIIMCLDGKCEVITDGKTVTTMQRGETLLVPASTSEIEVNGKATLLTAQA